LWIEILHSERFPRYVVLLTFLIVDFAFTLDAVLHLNILNDRLLRSNN